MNDHSKISTNLISDLKKGDQKAFKFIFDLLCSNLVYFSYNIVKDQSTAENIVQDVFLHIWEKRKSLNEDQNLKTYLYTIVKNRSLKYIRHQNVVHKNEPELKLIYSDKIEIDKKIESEELSRQYEKAINKLPEKCREIFLLSRNYNLKYKEIAELLGISVKTVETQISRALKTLRDYLSHLITIILTFFVGGN